MSARKPTALKILEGTDRPDRSNPNEPQPELIVDPPKPPDDLDSYAKAKWDELAPRLMRQRLLTEADLEMLALTCSAYSMWRRARDVIMEGGITYEATTEAGATLHRKRPEVEVEADGWRRYKAGLQAFGQSPETRPKVSASHEDYVDPAEEFLGGSSSRA